MPDLELPIVKQGVLMGARHELNKVHIVGSLGLAGVLGLVTGSMAVFVIASAALIGAALCTGQIRPRRGGR
jgi:hypothetical protein